MAWAEEAAGAISRDQAVEDPVTVVEDPATEGVAVEGVAVAAVAAVAVEGVATVLRAPAGSAGREWTTSLPG